MFNGLPETSNEIKKYTQSSNKLTDWRVADANPNKKISKALASEISPNITFTQQYSQNKLPVAAPNQRFLNSISHENDISPLSELARGVSDIATIQYDKIEQQKVVDKQRSIIVCKSLVLKLSNSMPSSMDLFVQNLSSMQSYILRSNKQCIRYWMLTPEWNQVMCNLLTADVLSLASD